MGKRSKNIPWNKFNLTKHWYEHQLAAKMDCLFDQGEGKEPLFVMYEISLVKITRTYIGMCFFL